MSKSSDFRVSGLSGDEGLWRVNKERLEKIQNEHQASGHPQELQSEVNPRSEGRRRTQVQPPTCTSPDWSSGVRNSNGRILYYDT